MKYFLSIVLIAIFSCNNKENNNPPSQTNTTQDTSTILQSPSGAAINLIDDYIITDTLNDYILFPLRVKDAKDKEESSLLYSKREGEGALYWNIVFYNYKTNENALLEPNNKILIGGYSFYESYFGRYGVKEIPAGKIETHKKVPYIFYTVYKDDYNNDSKLGTDDPAYFFISNTDGTGFRQVSPLNINITKKSFPKNNSTMLLEGQKDSNGDKKFNEKDEMVYYKVNMADSIPQPQEIFSPSFKIELKKLFDKNWKK